MIRALKETGVSSLASSRLASILNTEISATVMARRKMDERQTVLSILTGFAAASATLNLFEPVIFPISLALGFSIVWAAYSLGHQWAAVYPDNRLAKFTRSPFYRLLPIVGGVIFLIAFAVVATLLLNRRLFPFDF